MALDLNNKKAALFYATLWAKGKLQAMINEFDAQEGIAASGSISIKKEDVGEFCEYLKSLEGERGYVKLDLALFFQDSERPGDFSGKVSQPYVKGDNTERSATRQLRSL